ncbi:acetyl-CoA carboxylase biotin carboxyl carrier protein [Oceanobacillus sp. J11TS1]|uniref:acetyl-CoA carboxylase biotin carboxyl carrier protein n=1 Tax=Oceanobacillus sp. J11TS1 TaxID=2807191 RepID=UPI001B1B9699|nr:acetyl-CoA carboxylase biotin carboxyl carrier protein [Oceanobacillus sp. J11TS1]GIO23170.1 biotin carboxyl carrier protein of acetyl-CoA carboxylase [Oceanobacillus sp. J11TS1]
MLNVDEIREIIQMVDKSSLTEFSYEANGAVIAMKKNTGSVTTVPSQPQVVTDTVVAPVQEAKSEEVTQQAEQKVEEHAAPSANYDYEIVSPMVGTFYASSSPDSEPFVKQGSTVNADTVVCIVEAMKLFNEIEAEINGEIVDVLVENGELVEYGQPLFRVKKK